MSKIEEYKQAKRVAALVDARITRALGRDTSNNDKHRLRFCAKGHQDDRFGPFAMFLEGESGYYGSSSCSSEMNSDVARYIMRAANAMICQIADRAIEFAKMDAEKARVAAESEARDVLREMSDEAPDA